MSRNATSPRAIARTTSVTVWLPMLPPVPMSSGMKKAQGHHRASSSSKLRRTVPVYASATNSSSSQPTRLRTSSGTPTQSVRQVQRLGAAEALDVLGRLGLEDVGDVVLGDDAEQVVVVVDDGDREQVAVGQQAGGGLLVGSRRGRGRSMAP